jgi:superoxide reductase
MVELVPNTVDASGEKHLPVVTVESDDRGMRVHVAIGSVAHPMTAAHLINWIFVETNKGGHRRVLSASDKPEASFMLNSDEMPIAVYAYCNLHGLWMAEIEEKLVCDLKPLDTKSKEDYVICKCNNVSYFDILDEVHKHNNVCDLLEMFEDVKNTTHCSTGCGGCHDKILDVISEIMSK